MPKTAPETGWLIEEGKSAVSSPCYWAGGNQWQPDSMTAIRFARERDARQVMRFIEFDSGYSHRASEHSWG